MKEYKIQFKKNRQRNIRLLPNGNIEIILPNVTVPEKGTKRISNKTMTDSKLWQHIEKNSKRFFMGSAAVSIAMVVLTGILALILSTGPHTIKVDGTDICYVNGKIQGEKVVENLLNEYTPEGTVVKAIDIDKKFEIDRVSRVGLDKSKLMSIEDATAYVLNDYQTGDKAFSVTIASAKTTDEKYVPEPNYEKDDTMLAGECKVIKKGKDGKQRVTVTYISVNGDIKSEAVTARTILDEGEKATVKKGTLGLPDGEDWKTFNGNPVFKNGDELGTTALQYLGAPYKYGGTSLTNGIDCVQFVRQMYAKYGIHLSNSDVYHGGKGVSLNDAKRGDIICYKNHVAIYLGDGKVVHALKKGVSVSDVNFRKVQSVRRIVN